SLLLVTAAFGLLALGRHELWALVVGILIADAGLQGIHIQNQQLIFAIDPAARSRLNTAYIVSYFIGGAIGSATTGVADAAGGWTAVVVLGTAYAAGALVVWAAAALVGIGRRSATPPT
ncbi:MAG TPA: hypothetical protein VEJ44_00690, partial [Acidimicrobiales bacterium]|nr:hypothetical protein [Acidimicrobiales bacterium]